MVKLRALFMGLLSASVITMLLSLVFPVITDNKWAEQGQLVSTSSFSILNLGTTGLFTILLMILTITTIGLLYPIFKGDKKITQIYLYLPTILFLVFYLFINLSKGFPDYYFKQFIVAFNILVLIHGYILTKKKESLFKDPKMTTGVLVAASIVPFYELILIAVNVVISLIQSIIDLIVILDFTIPVIINMIIGAGLTLYSLQIYKKGYEELLNGNFGNAQRIMVVPFVIISLVYMGTFWLGLIAFNRNQSIVGLILTGIVSAYLVKQVYDKHNLSILAILPTVLSFMLIYQIEDKVRNPLIRNAYLNSVAFGHPAPPALGYYMIILSIFFTFLITRLKISYTNEGDEYVTNLDERISFSGDHGNVVERVGLSLKRRFWGPTTLQYLVIHIISLITMMLTYGLYFDNVSYLDGPAYYLEAFYTFGLNRFGVAPQSTLDFAWILAPPIILAVGIVFFYLTATGFAPNGAPLAETIPENSYADPGVGYETWAYFSKTIPFAETYFGSPKMNLFYILVVFMPFFIGIVLGGILNHYVFGDEKKVRFFAYLRFFAIIAFYFGYTFASVTAPVIIVPTGIIASIFVERRTNSFIRYRWTDPSLADAGAYSPLSQFWIILILIIPFIIIATMVDHLIRLLLGGKLFEEKENVQVVGKVIDESETTLPWEILEEEEEKQQENTINQ